MTMRSTPAAKLEQHLQPDREKVSNAGPPDYVPRFELGSATTIQDLTVLLESFSVEHRQAFTRELLCGTITVRVRDNPYELRIRDYLLSRGVFATYQVLPTPIKGSAPCSS